MLAEERFSKILSIINMSGSVTVTDLVEKLNISESTIRRDLNTMDQKGLLVKVHGGAVSKSFDGNTRDEAVQSRKSIHTEDKRRIARYAASLIREDDFVYLDAGTTTELMIEYIDAPRAVFVTNAILHAEKLAARGYSVYIPGGQLKTITEAVVGEEAVESLQKYHFTKGFWGTNGVSRAAGFTTPDMKEAMVKSLSMQHCVERYVLADISKFSRVSNVTFADFDSAVILTSGELPEEYTNLKSIYNI